ncbi:MAG: hypothetical protein WCJ81_09270 [bacterium]
MDKVVDVPYATCTPPIPESIAQEILSVIPVLAVAQLFPLIVNDPLYGA